MLDFNPNSPLGIIALVLILLACIAVVVVILLRKPKFKKQDMTMDSLLGKTAVVTEIIDYDAGTGMVEINGAGWAAQSIFADDVYQVNDKVEIVAIEGVKLIVKKVK